MSKALRWLLGLQIPVTALNCNAFNAYILEDEVKRDICKQTGKN